MAAPLRIGISQCLLGELVRYDGGHKRDAFLIEVLGPHVEWVPVCPEMELGLGTPREPMRLVGDPRAPRLITITTGVDHTDTMIGYARQRVRELEELHLSGYVFKAGSPSCGIGEVPLGAGLFARAFITHFPSIPLEEERRLQDLQAVKNFLERARGSRRSRNHV